jgi:transcriptional regulator with XRE-family HTH domain
MRNILKQARENTGITQKETASKIGVSERYYQKIEAGTNEGKGRIWDALEALFKVPQRQLRENDLTQENFNTEFCTGQEVEIIVEIALGDSEKNSSTNIHITIPGILRKDRIEEILEAARRELEARVEVIG